MHLRRTRSFVKMWNPLGVKELHVFPTQRSPKYHDQDTPRQPLKRFW